MIIKCANLGLIKKAEITIDGITVIAGENDTGKSTVSKLMFILSNILDIRNIDNYKVRLRKRNIQSAINNIRNSNDNSAMRVLNRAIHVSPYINNLLKELSESCDDNRIHEILFLIESKLKENMNDEGAVYNESFLKKYLNNVYVASKKEFQNDELISIMLKRYFKSLFDNDICSKYSDEFTSVQLVENGISLIDLELKDNNIEKIEYLYNTGVGTVTYVESPLILQYSSMIEKARTVLDADDSFPAFFDIAQVDVISKDLINKLTTPFGILDDNDTEISKDISQIIDGNVKYDETSSTFIYDKDGIVYNIKNTASGIKTFGILQVLIEKGFLGENTLLILDEPEVNVHPKWQIKYAELIVKLAKQLNVKILLNSHSPYFIEAIHILSKYENFDSRVNFYEAKKCNESKFTSIEKIHNVDSIFAALSEPFDTLDEIRLSNF